MLSLTAKILGDSPILGTPLRRGRFFSGLGDVDRPGRPRKLDTQKNEIENLTSVVETKIFDEWAKSSEVLHKLCAIN